MISIDISVIGTGRVKLPQVNGHFLFALRAGILYNDRSLCCSVESSGLRFINRVFTILLKGPKDLQLTLLSPTVDTE